MGSEEGLVESMKDVAEDERRPGVTKQKQTVALRDLTLSKGGLSELAGLEDLADFEMRTDLWSGMGQAEVEFMHEKWPRLRKITFGTWSTTFRKLMMEPHWLWLQARRPQLQFGWTNPAN
ncbi:hypothetical protein BGZ75_002502 [Mortierella antarctica]|nr:hypothetical protein BGZ75_002502 [Mortierella antarctica]